MNRRDMLKAAGATACVATVPVSAADDAGWIDAWGEQILEVLHAKGIAEESLGDVALDCVQQAADEVLASREFASFTSVQDMGDMTVRIGFDLPGFQRTTLTRAMAIAAA